MVTVSQLRAIDPAALGGIADRLSGKNHTFTQALDDMSHDVDTTTTNWKGDAADTASMRALGEHLSGSHVATAIAGQIEAFQTTLSSLGPARTTALSIADDAIRVGCTVFDDGRVTAPDVSEAHPWAGIIAQAAANDKAYTYEAKLKPALATYDELDTTAAALLNTATDNLDGLARVPESADPRAIAIAAGKETPPADPKAFHDWWVGLSPVAKDAAWQRDQYLGNRDGMPCEDRDRYNRIKLDDEFTRAASAKDQIDQLTRQHPQWVNKDNVTESERNSPVYQQWKTQYDDARNRSKSLADLTTVKEPSGAA